MLELTYTLIGDGSSDKALLNIIDWTISDLYPKLAPKSQFADFSNLKNPPPKGEVFDQIRFAEKYYPFDLLIYHRDAENNTKTIINERKQEVFGQITDEFLAEKVVCVVPVVMMESWLLFDETAIKKASENKNYPHEIPSLPAIKEVEDIKDPKLLLHNLLRKVSCKKKRSLKEFNVHRAVHLVADYIDDFSPLRQLNSFKQFEKDLKDCVDKIISSTRDLDPINSQ